MAPLATTTRQGYRKLSFFSGQLSTPVGEEEFEIWMDQATQAVEDWSIPEAVKRQQLSESFRSLAAEVFRSLRIGKKDCVAMNYIEAVYAIFGKGRVAFQPSRQIQSHSPNERGRGLYESHSQARPFWPLCHT